MTDVGTDASWSALDGDDCVRLRAGDLEANVQVRAGAAVVVGDFPPMTGRFVRDGDDVCFVPRFPFVDGTTYTVVVDGAVAAVLVRPRPDGPATTEVVGIHPTVGEVPRNLLRLYVSFSAPMSEGQATRHVRLVDDADDELTGALLPTEHELWDGSRRRLTVLLDPARIKRGLVGHRETGYPLQAGVPFRLVVDDRFRDASGTPLRARAERRYQVGDDERRRVDPGRWVLALAGSGTSAPLEVSFERPLDHGLLARCLHVVGPDGRPVEGTSEPGEHEHSWSFQPWEAWARGTHQLVVDRVLEDLAGNSVGRVFDRDLTSAADDPRSGAELALTFRPGC